MKKTRTSSTSTQNTHLQTTPNNPAWVDSGLAGLGGQVSDLSKMDPYSLVAGTNPFHDKAASTLGGLGKYSASGFGGGSPSFGFSPAPSNSGAGLLGGGFAGDRKMADIAAMQGRPGGVTGGLANAFRDAQASYDPSKYGQFDPSAPVDPSVMMGGRKAAAVPGWLAPNAGASPGGFDPFATGMGAALSAASGGPSTYEAALGKAKGYGASTGTAASLLDGGLGRYMSPYKQDVVDTSLADYDYGAGQSRAQAALDMAGSGAFGGSGAAITKNMLEDSILRGRGSLSAGLHDQMFNTGANLANLDASRRQEMSLANMSAVNEARRFGADATNSFGFKNMDALNGAREFNANAMEKMYGRQNEGARTLADLATGKDANTRANAGAESGIAEILRMVEQAQRSAPIDLFSKSADIWGKLPLDLLHGVTTDTSMTGTTKGKTKEFGLSGEDFATIAAAAIAASDERLKRDVVKLGERSDGLGVYLYRYLWSPLQFIGVMAQEVLKVKPEAVLTMPNGFYAVDYSKLGDA